MNQNTLTDEILFRDMVAYRIAIYCLHLWSKLIDTAALQSKEEITPHYFYWKYNDASYLKLHIELFSSHPDDVDYFYL